MAFIDNQDDKQLDPNAPEGQNPVVGQGTNVVGGGGGSAAGVGPGGTGGWTNIQAYLDANKGDTGSSQLLNKTVGDQFGQERSNFEGDSSKFLTDAQAQADSNKISNDQASGYINQAAQAYQYPGDDGKGGFDYAPVSTGTGQFSGTPLQKATPKITTPTLASETDPTQQADYSGIVGKFQKALNDPYAGPKEYNYGFGDKTQQYANDLNDNPSFDTLMSGLYSNAAGSPLTSGQYELQKQFDVNNQALGDTRNSLNDQYNQLTADRDKTVTDTTTGLGNVEQNYRTGQNALRDYLSGQSNTYDENIGKEEAAARDAYNTDYTTGTTGKKSIAMDQIAAQNSDRQDQMADRFRNHNIWGDNLTWKQLQDENSQVGINDNSADNRGGVSWFDQTGTLQPELNARKDVLGNWYGNEDKKFAGTADQDKRAYNALQDFLNSGATKRDQAFHVRG